MMHYLKKRNLSQDLQIKIRRYLEFTHFEEKEGLKRGKNIFHDLTNSLQDQISNEYFSKFINKVPLLKQKFSQKFIYSLTPKMLEISIPPGEFICQVYYYYLYLISFIKDDIKNLGIYFVVEGKVSLQIKTNNLKNKNYVEFAQINVKK